MRSSDEEDEGSGESSDSDEELDSPRRIHQLPATSAGDAKISVSGATSSNKTETMDVDSSDSKCWIC